MIAHLNIGRILRTQGDFNGAKSALQSARRSCDTHETCGIVDNGLGLVYADLGDWTSAALTFEIFWEGVGTRKRRSISEPGFMMPRPKPPFATIARVDLFSSV